MDNDVDYILRGCSMHLVIVLMSAVITTHTEVHLLTPQFQRPLFCHRRPFLTKNIMAYGNGLRMGSHLRNFVDRKRNGFRNLSRPNSTH